MRRHIAAWCIAALGLGALAACANESPSSPAAGQSSSTGPVTSPVPASPPPTPRPTSPPIMKPPSPTVKPSRIVIGTPVKPLPSGQLTLTGTIYAGAEPSCLLIMQGRATYLLNAAASWKLRAGQRVIVSGTVAPRGTMSHCMQGTPFLVADAEVLSPNG